MELDSLNWTHSFEPLELDAQSLIELDQLTWTHWIQGVIVWRQRL